MSPEASPPEDNSKPPGFSPTKQPPSPEEGAGFQPPASPHELKVQEAKTARLLTYGLVSLLAASVFAQYAVLAALVCKNRTEAIPNFEHLFNTWLPVIAGLASSAVTYYLTREKK
jgi:hypothetical protein